MAKLKVFRTSTGFHDAYVAAPSRKAALAAWGTDRDLFARGAAEEVTDAALTEAPLARPGEVIKVSRGDREAQMAALPEGKPKPSRPNTKSKAKAAAKPKPVAKPKPSRADLDAAEEALAAAETRHEQERAELAAEAAVIERRQRDLKREQDREIAGFEAAREEAEATYRTSLERWRE